MVFNINLVLVADEKRRYRSNDARNPNFSADRNVSPRKMKCITIVNVLEPLDFLVNKIMLKLVSAIENKHIGSCKSS